MLQALASNAIHLVTARVVPGLSLPPPNPGSVLSRPIGGGVGSGGEATVAAPELTSQIRDLQSQVASLESSLADLAHAAGIAADAPSRLSIAQGYIWVVLVSFLVTLAATPLMRILAIKNGIVDRPSDPRKVHRIPVAYLGGMAVFLGILAGIFFSFLALRFPGLVDFHPTAHIVDDEFLPPVPPSILIGLTVIMLVGLLDDVMGISPRVKLGGQLFAAAALALDNVGTRLAAGALLPIAEQLGVPTSTINGVETIGFVIPLPFDVLGGNAIPVDMIYWIGTAIIAIAVLGMCNATNLLDGLDGLLSGTTAISAAGLLVMALGLALLDDGPRDGQRIILCMALLGACLGFLPHNFNPATIFLGDTGSLLLGYCACVIILTLGDTGKTHLVAAGCVIFAVPLIDTSLAIVRRKLEGKSISSADSNHLHHMLKRALGVKGAVLVLYAMAASFATLGVAVSVFRARVIYVLAAVLAAFIGVTAIKIARRRFIEEQAARYAGGDVASATSAAAATMATGSAVASDAATGPATGSVTGSASSPAKQPAHETVA
jgi:UDP-GlcNAc:undecaprenyl-phosphate GlcNAc-1-phosphate transferase